MTADIFSQTNEVKQLTWELFTLQGWDVVKDRLVEMQKKYEVAVVVAARTDGDTRYAVGKLDGVLECITYLNNLEQDARPRN